MYVMEKAIKLSIMGLPYKSIRTQPIARFLQDGYTPWFTKTDRTAFVSKLSNAFIWSINAKIGANDIFIAARVNLDLRERDESAIYVSEPSLLEAETSLRDIGSD
ncbi:hypothetical protein KIN20_022367 [Parelaphostrongylus tenuis]|uniref:Uncharacterized protein n=1 Tax=Parelaphostrongylus tenuis TaxID=148309 RepID=A0AAD5QWQ7_PARTN|nr:hypothetical protein KIN20_022367 [Parelaphostrongylus tenuis]